MRQVDKRVGWGVLGTEAAEHWLDYGVAFCDGMPKAGDVQDDRPERLCPGCLRVIAGRGGTQHEHLFVEAQDDDPFAGPLWRGR